MTKIVGHRGAAGLAPENTLAAIRAGKQAGADMLEFDVQRTRDGQFVVCHDPNLRRVSDSPAIIEESTYDQIAAVTLHGGGHVPLLRDVLTAAGDTPVVVELKITNHVAEVCKLLDEFPKLDITIATFNKSVAKTCKRFRPHTPVLLGHHHLPLLVVQIAKAQKLDGIDINFGILNPLTYWLAKRANLRIMAYTVNSPFAARIIRRFYPDVWICTNYPNRFSQPAKQV